LVFRSKISNPKSEIGCVADDLFDFFRIALGVVVTIYATVVTLQSLWGWYVWLAGSDRYVSLIRRYVILHGLRLRFRAFWGDVIICLLLCVVLLLLWYAHHIVIYDIGEKLQNVSRPV
jgi:hypothetical protein